jgi:glucosamine-6-phosphate deaminase
VGLPAEHPQRYLDVIKHEFAERVDFASGAIHGPDGLATDIPTACAAYDDAITGAGGVDLVARNDPPTPPPRHRAD